MMADNSIRYFISDGSENPLIGFGNNLSSCPVFGNPGDKPILYDSIEAARYDAQGIDSPIGDIHISIYRGN